MKKYSYALFLIAFVPSVASAAWWNPTTWGGDQGQSQISTLNQTITEKDNEIAQLRSQQTATTSVSAAPDPLLQENQTLQRQIASLKAQIASTKPVSCPVAQTPAPIAPAPSASSVDIKAINVELAQLDLIDSYIDSYATSSLIDLGNQTKGLPGYSPEFDDSLFITHIGQSSIFSTYNLPDRQSMHGAVKLYREQLQLRLMQDQ